LRRKLGKAYVVTSLGGLLLTFDLPLLRLSFADNWTMVFTRGMFLFIAIAGAWSIGRLARDGGPPFIAGKAGLAVALSSTVGNIAYIGAVVATQAANVVFLIALTPVIAAALARLVLRESVHNYTWAATACAFLGGGIIASDGLQSGSWLGDALAVTSALCSAITLTIIRGTGEKVATSLALGNLSSALIAVAFFSVAPTTLAVSGGFGVPAWAWLAINGFIAIPLATVLLARGPRVLPSADVSMFFMLETVLTPIWVWLLFGEVPGTTVAIGGMIVVITLISHSWWKFRVSIRAISERTSLQDA
jgi:drug/metabolite transporter (DMT)-like permease